MGLSVLFGGGQGVFGVYCVADTAVLFLVRMPSIPFLNSWRRVGTKLDGGDFCNVDRRVCQRSPVSLLFFTPFCCKLGAW